MGDGTLHLLVRRRFLPLFAGQCLGALNDNLFKNALAVLVVYRLGGQAGLSAPVLATLAGGVFIAPYFLFSALAGQVSDRFEKSGLMKLCKALEIPIVALAAWGLAAADLGLMLGALFLLGAQATFTGPIKYAVLPELLREGEWVGGNALREGGTFLAILLGTIAGGALVLAEGGPLAVGAIMMVLALAGLGASLALPRAHGGNPQVAVSLDPLAETRDLWRLTGQSPPLRRAVLGISWFWLLGALCLAQFPAFAKEVLAADGQAVTLMLAMFSLGTALGSLLCGWLLAGEMTTRPVALAALGMGLFAIDLWLAAPTAVPADGSLAALPDFLARPGNWRILADLLLLAVCGGFYTVPLYTQLQAHSAEASRARVIAANNLVNAAFMVAGAGLAGLLLALGLGVTGLFLLLGLATLAVALGFRRAAGRWWR